MIDSFFFFHQKCFVHIHGVLHQISNTYKKRSETQVTEKQASKQTNNQNPSYRTISQFFSQLVRPL